MVVWPIPTDRSSRSRHFTVNLVKTFENQLGGVRWFHHFKWTQNSNHLTPLLWFEIDVHFEWWKSPYSPLVIFKKFDRIFGKNTRSRAPISLDWSNDHSSCCLWSPEQDDNKISNIWLENSWEKSIVNPTKKLGHSVVLAQICSVPVIYVCPEIIESFSPYVWA